MMETVRRRIAECAGVPVDSLDDHDEIHDDLGIPSVEMIRLVGVLEEDNSIAISDGEIDETHTVAELVALVVDKATRR